jgi:hypothetical protein
MWIKTDLNFCRCPIVFPLIFHDRDADALYRLALSRKGMVFLLLQISDITRAAKRVCYREIAQAKAA